MTALAANKNVQHQGDAANPQIFANGQLTATTIYQGALCVIDAAGFTRPGLTATGVIACGIAMKQSVNAGASGAVKVETRQGVFGFVNGGAIVQATVGRPVYIVDDQTVHETDGTGTRSKAGICVGFEGAIVLVKVELPIG